MRLLKVARITRMASRGYGRKRSGITGGKKGMLFRFLRAQKKRTGKRGKR